MTEFTKNDMFWIRSSLIRRKHNLYENGIKNETQFEEYGRLLDLIEKISKYLVEQNKLEMEQRTKGE